jgi:hypothetical protein
VGPQLVDDLLHLKGSSDGLNQHSRADGAAAHTQLVCRVWRGGGKGGEGEGGGVG